jgi:hypothetical protein
MSNTQTNKRSKDGTKYRVSNPPNRNGNGERWANFGNLFIDAQGKHGTLYLDVTTEQLKALLGQADAEGRVKVKIGVRRNDGKKDAGDGAPAAAA